MSKYAELNAIKTVAELMAASIRTAPKGRGIDNIVTKIIRGKNKKQLANKMYQFARRHKNEIFARDGANVENSHLVVLVGTKFTPIGLGVCGLCGFKNCQHLLKEKGLCIFNSLDLGIAIGSAISIANNFHIDNRLMYTIGMAALELNLLGKDVKLIIGIPLSVTGKNIFFDRKQ